MNKLTTFIFVALLGLLLLPSAQLLAQGDPLGLEYGRASGLGEQDVRSTTAGVINVALSLLGIIALVLIVYAGFMWMTAAGNSEQIDKAKGILRAAIIGLVIILMAYSITQFVVDNLTDVTGVDRGE
jgi:uncharacterized membrane protein